MLAYLRAHPGFLAAHPTLYEALLPPDRVHGAPLADHMQAMIGQARHRAAEAERMAAETAATRRAAEGFGRRVQEAVLALMRAPDPAWLAVNELASLLLVDAARLSAEALLRHAGVAGIPGGTIAAALGQRAAVVRAMPERAGAAGETAGPLLHGEAVGLAAAEALVRVPTRNGPALLALACRDGAGLAGATTDALAFLGQAVGAALDRVPKDGAP